MYSQLNDSLQLTSFEVTTAAVSPNTHTLLQPRKNYRIAEKTLGTRYFKYMNTLYVIIKYTRVYYTYHLWFIYNTLNTIVRSRVYQGDAFQDDTKYAGRTFRRAVRRALKSRGSTIYPRPSRTNRAFRELAIIFITRLRE